MVIKKGKKFFAILLMACIGFNTVLADESKRIKILKKEVYNLDDLVYLTKSLSYDVREQGFSVYKAQKTVGALQTTITPHINLAAVVGVFTFDYFTVASAFLGFLFPSNWYDINTANSLLLAEKYSFETLLANQINAVINLAYGFQYNRDLMAYYGEEERDLLQVKSKLTEVQNTTQVDQDVADRFDLIIKNVRLRREALERVIATTKHALADAVGIPLPLRERYNVARIEVDNKYYDKDDYVVSQEEFEDKVEKRSREIKTFDRLIDAALDNKKSRQWRFFHPAASEQDSLGYGWADNYRIANGEVGKLQARRDKTTSGLYKAYQDLTAIHNNQNKLHRTNTEAAATAMRLRKRNTLQPKEFAEYLASLPERVEDSLQFNANLIGLKYSSARTAANRSRLFWEKPLYENLQEWIPKQYHESTKEYILGQQEDSGYLMEEFVIRDHRNKGVQHVFTNRHMYFYETGTVSTDSDFSEFERGKFRMQKDGKVKMTFQLYYAEVKKSYFAIGTVDQSSYGFANTCDMDFKIYDQEIYSRTGSLSAAEKGSFSLTD